jgi:mono/diheme cytochrome c family protein
MIVSLLTLSAFVAAGCGGGPRDAAAQLASACDRQVKEITASKANSKIVTAKSSDVKVASENLHECAGQAPMVAATTSTDTTATGTTSTGAGATPTPATTTTLDPAARTLFASTCGGCHMLADAKTMGAVGPNLDNLNDDAARVLMQIKNGQGAMPAGLLMGADAQKVANYVAAASQHNS